MPPDLCEHPRRRIAKAFARISTPTGIAQKSMARPNVAHRERILPPLAAPSQLPATQMYELFSHPRLPLAPRRVRQPHPHKMKQLVDQNALELSAPCEYSAIQQ